MLGRLTPSPTALTQYNILCSRSNKYLLESLMAREMNGCVNQVRSQVKKTRAMKQRGTKDDTLVSGSDDLATNMFLKC